MVAEESAESDSDYSCTALELETQTGDVALPAVPGEAWIVDSGTTSHVARERRLFVEYTSTPGRTLHGAGSTPILGARLYSHAVCAWREVDIDDPAERLARARCAV